VLSVLGSRPEVIQAAPVSRALRTCVDEVLVDTGQHYDHAMSEGQIFDTGLRRPHYNLNVGSRPDLEQLEVAQDRIAEVIRRERPDAVVVRGDTNSTLAGARAAVAAELPLIHIEAGLRSYRDDMPEERNRVETDRISDLLCVPTRAALANLRTEGLDASAELTGDVLYDMLLTTRETVGPSGEQGSYALATVHRNYNTDDALRLRAVLDCLAAVPCRVILPVHPRTRQRLDQWSLTVPKNVELRDPVTYRSMLALERDATAILTDSGGVQREAYMWGVPCITLREETEWVETVFTGWNALVGVEPDRVRAAFEAGRPDESPLVFGDGNAAAKIADAIVTSLEQSAEHHVAV
jgi:UDP-N-acetylglucosamine 2-epimerase